MMSIAQINALPATACADLFAACCGSSRWVSRLVGRRPFESFDELRRVADDTWWSLDAIDWLEAFAHHPRIGEQRSASLQSARAASWSAGEQAGVATATAHTQSELSAINAAYEAKFGFIYIVSAAGRSASELLDIARARLTNDPTVELRVAAEEQRKITSLRLEKLIMESMNTLSTHVLDTSIGRPASGVRVRLERVGAADQITVGAGITDDNGRLTDLVASGLTAATYRLRFDVAEYFARTGRPALFPEVAVMFIVSGADEHYHIPVLLSPFGYTTYRGS